MSPTGKYARTKQGTATALCSKRPEPPVTGVPAPQRKPLVHEHMTLGAGCPESLVASTAAKPLAGAKRESLAASTKAQPLQILVDLLQHVVRAAVVSQTGMARSNRPHGVRDPSAATTRFAARSPSCRSACQNVSKSRSLSPRIHWIRKAPKLHISLQKLKTRRKFLTFLRILRRVSCGVDGT